MGVGLQPLEFTECLTDSPQFRENLQNHEKELERTSQQIKRLIREVKEIVQAAKRLSAAQLALATSMEQIEFACIGASMTDDELIISRSLSHFAAHIRTVEDERERMLGNAHEQIILPLERFRKDHIGTVKEGKKKFDKKTGKFCQTQERTLALSAKKVEAERLREADAAMDMAERDFCQASLEYAFLLQAVHERKKFELVETLLGFVFGWWTFHHQAHEVHRDAEPLVRDLQLRIQRTRNNFDETSKQTESLMKKMMEMRQMSKESSWSEEEGGVRSGHVLVLERKAFGSAWVRHYCAYASGTMRLTPYVGAAPPLVLRLRGARPVADSERRFCWEALPSDRERAPTLLQSPSERERAGWLRAVCGELPPAPTPEPPPAACIDQHGMNFVLTVVALVEERGLTEQGLYRVAGVASKVARAVRAAADPALLAELAAAETRTLTSALKAYLRALPEPLLTARAHDAWLAAARLEPAARAARAAALQAALPPPNRRLLRVLLAHLRRVAARAALTLMPPANLAVCFGPTLLRPPRETVASILNLKFYNVIVETLLLLPDHDPDHDHEEPAPARPAPPGDHSPHHDHDHEPPYDPHDHAVPPDHHELNNGSVVGPPAPACLPSRTDHARSEARYSWQHQALLRQLSPSPPGGAGGARVRTLYACLGESAGELSFEPNQIITDVLPSGERGWLRGTLDGRAGLVPENYVQPLP